MQLIPKPVVPAPIEAETLKQVIAATHRSNNKLAAAWGLNYHTTGHRIARPTTLKLGELFTLADVLHLEAADLLDVISLESRQVRPAQPVPVLANTLAGIIESDGRSYFKLAREWKIDSRTALRRAALPDTLLVRELFALARLLQVQAADILRIIHQQLARAKTRARP